MPLVDLTDFQFNNKNKLKEQEHVYIKRESKEYSPEFLSLLHQLNASTGKVELLMTRAGLHRDLYGPYEWEKGTPKLIDKDLYTQMNYNNIMEDFETHCERCGKKLSAFDNLIGYSICCDCDGGLEYDLYFQELRHHFGRQ